MAKVTASVLSGTGTRRTSVLLFLGVEPASLDALRDEWLAQRAGGEVRFEER